MSDTPSVPLATVAYDDRTARDFMLACIIWGAVGMLVGVLIALQIFVPAANLDLPWTTFGRLRPLHTNAVIFAFAGNAIFAGMYYSSQRLLKTRMWSDRLSRFHFWGWQAIIVAAAVTLPLGITTSKEYAELEWPIDIAIAVVWVAMTANFVMTIVNRRERHLYVAIWFYLATFVGIALLHVVNSLAIPAGPLKSYSVYAGIQDALVQWWYGHNAVAFFLTTPFLGLMYYFLPKAAGRPVYSYRLSIVHFWSLVLLYIWAGPHHLLNSAVPEWAQTMGVVFSIMLWAPSWGGMINGLLTLRGAWDRVRQDPVLKFYVAAVTYYGMATFEGPLLSLREVNALGHTTDWIIGHVHSGALGWNGLLAFGLAYWLIPRLYRTELHSKAAANLHFWLATLAIILYSVAMWVGGIAQGAMQLMWDDNGRLAYGSWNEIVRASVPFYWIRLAAGLLYFAGIVVALWNLFATIRRSGNRCQDQVVQVPTLPADEAIAPHVDRALDAPGGPRAKANALHALIERWPTLMIALIAVGLAVGSFLQIVPSLVQGALTKRVESIKPWTPLELYGRDLYIREGCVGCHTQVVRTLRAEVARYGDYTRPSEGVYDRPFLWGSKRTGPDLAREGLLKPSAAWHYDHLVDPALVSEGSIMPRYSWLARDEMDLAVLPARMSALSVLPLSTYRPAEIAGSVAAAEAQAKAVADELRATKPELKGREGLERKEIIAMIAYLKRLGTDWEKAKKELR